MHKFRTVILGGGYAGMMAAARLRHQKQVEVTLVDHQEHFEQRIRLHQVLAGQAVPRLPLATALSRQGIHFVQGRIEKIDPISKSVKMANSKDLPYDFLIYALGSQADTQGVPGLKDHCHFLTNQDQTQTLATELETLVNGKGASSTLIALIGGGLSNIEIATELAERFPGIQIEVFARGNLESTYSQLGSQYLRQRFDELNIRWHENQDVVRVDAKQLTLASGQRHGFDWCLAATGFKANGVALNSEFPVNDRGQILVKGDGSLAKFDTIFVAGDAAAYPSSHLRMGCVSAMPMGAHAAANVLARSRGKPTKSHQFGFMMRCISLGRKKGLIQFVDTIDQVKEKIWTDRKGGLTKELICKMTYYLPQWELKSGLPFYWWPKTPIKESVPPQAFKSNQKESAS